MSEESLNDLFIENDQSRKIEYAGGWLRFKAAFIDRLVTLPIGAFIIYNFLSIKSFYLLIIAAIILMLYKPLTEWRYSATVGKMVSKIKVTNENQEFITLDQAFGRNIPWIINHFLSLISYYYIFQTDSFLAMDNVSKMSTLKTASPIESVSTIYFYIFLVIVGSLINDKKRQGFHDKIANTYCIKISKH